MIIKTVRPCGASAIAVAVVLSLAYGVAAAENVRAQLAREQQRTGLTIRWYYSGINTVHFKDRSVTTDRVSLQTHNFENALISPDGSMFAFPTSGPDAEQPLTIVRRDGTPANQFPEVADGRALCWSHDATKLVVRSKTDDSRPPQYRLFVLSLDSNSAKQFGEAESHATSQCWSPDNQQIVYSTKNKIQIFDLKANSSRDVAQGDFPTWSPDGQEIAFHSSDGYYAISPTGGVPRRLFKTKQGRSQLFWAPDSKMGAYLGTGGTFRETLRFLDVGLIQLRVVRLSDGSEDWVWQTPDVPPAWSLDCVWLFAKDSPTVEGTPRK